MVGEGFPFVFSSELACFGVVLVFGVVVRAVVEELRVDFHEEFHGVVDHAVDCSGVVSKLWMLKM